MLIMNKVVVPTIDDILGLVMNQCLEVSKLRWRQRPFAWKINELNAHDFAILHSYLCLGLVSLILSMHMDSCTWIGECSSEKMNTLIPRYS